MIYLNKKNTNNGQDNLIKLERYFTLSKNKKKKVHHILEFNRNMEMIMIILIRFPPKNPRTMKKNLKFFLL